MKHLAASLFLSLCYIGCGDNDDCDCDRGDDDASVESADGNDSSRQSSQHTDGDDDGETGTDTVSDADEESDSDVDDELDSDVEDESDSELDVDKEESDVNSETDSGEASLDQDTIADTVPETAENTEDDTVPNGETDTGGDIDTDTGTEIPVDSETQDGSDLGWRLVWSDEFDQEEIDGSKWEHEVNCWGGGNNEMQCYVDDAKNSYIEDGFLHIRAIADNPSGAVNPEQGDNAIREMDYSSARLRTKNRGDWTYGRFEIRAKLPEGQGLWPAIWMLPTDNVYGGWAASGEIDIMEAVNPSPDNNTIYGTLHYGGAWPDNQHSGEETTPPGYVAENFYTYAIEWEEGEIRWYLDDEHYSTQTVWNTQNGDFPAPFDEAFHLLLNVAVGGDWPGPPNAQTTFPQEMIVDYVRVYECASDPTTGRGCNGN